MGWVQPYEQSMALCRYIKGGNCKPEKVEEYWHRAFMCISKHLGFDKAARRILWEDLVCGNWEHLHQTEDEMERTADEWLEELRGDVFYTSDRASLDRLTRCHWLYRQYMRAATRRF